MLLTTTAAAHLNFKSGFSFLVCRDWIWGIGGSKDWTFPGRVRRHGLWGRTGRENWVWFGLDQARSTVRISLPWIWSACDSHTPGLSWRAKLQLFVWFLQFSHVVFFPFILSRISPPRIREFLFYFSAETMFFFSFKWQIVLCFSTRRVKWHLSLEIWPYNK